MSPPKDRAANREKRRAKRSNRRDDGPLLRLVQEDVPRRPVAARVKELQPLTPAQEAYDASIRANLITFGIGPAGTGKTWWAAMRAAEALKNGHIERIIVTRPAVESGESLGFLPGEMDEKYEPYFRPVKDALEEYLGSGHLEYCIKAGIIEARPLAFLRGATIKHAWLIADEMQNSTAGQMKMLLTRIGENAKFIINGDPRQCDLPHTARSGLADAVRRLEAVNGVNVVRFREEDIVRHGIVQEIVRAYESDNSIPSSERYIEDNRSGLNRMLGING